MARVLVAEDDPATRRLIARILADFGHDVRERAEDGEARSWLSGGPVDVVVTDLVLRGDRGDRLARECKALGVAAVSLSGWAYRPGRGNGHKPPPLREKPFRVSDLKSVVDAVAAARPAPAPHL